MKKQSENKKYLPFFFVFFGALTLFFAFLGIFNSNYQKIYDMPEVENGVADFADYPFENRFIGFNLSGNWEFFYGVSLTDEVSEKEPDGYISLPSRWTWKDYGNGRLPKRGSASYRLLLKNVKAGQEIVFYIPDSDCAVKGYINGTLAYVREKTDGGWNESIFPYACDGGDVELIAEVKDSDSGGICATPWVRPKTIDTEYWSIVYNFPLIAVGLIIACFIFGLLMSAGFYRYDRDYIQPVLLCSIMLHLLTDREIVTQLHLSLSFSATMRLITGLIALLLLALQLKRLVGLSLSKKIIFPLGALYAVSFVGLFLSFGTPLDIFFFAAILIVSMLIVPFFILSRKVKTYLKIAYLSVFALTEGVLTMEIADMTGRIVFGTNYLVSGILTLLIVFFALIAFLRILSATRDLNRMGELEKQLSIARQNALSYQIEPHFIFNALNAIQDTYHKDTGSGDKALLNFSSYLRASADKDRSSLIPFQEELNNIMNYFELENLRKNGELRLLLDIETEDFKVPPFSVEPFVENAIKHGKLDSKNGCIFLSAMEEEGGVRVSIKDNGCGFDAEKTEFGVGIKNAAERLRTQLNAEVTIDGRPGEGTEVVVRIPF